MIAGRQTTVLPTEYICQWRGSKRGQRMICISGCRSIFAVLVKLCCRTTYVALTVVLFKWWLCVPKLHVGYKARHRLRIKLGIVSHGPKSRYIGVFFFFFDSTEKTAAAVGNRTGDFVPSSSAHYPLRDATALGSLYHCFQKDRCKHKKKKKQHALRYSSM